jgi:hypothetical protein
VSRATGGPSACCALLVALDLGAALDDSVACVAACEEAACEEAACEEAPCASAASVTASAAASAAPSCTLATSRELFLLACNLT